MLIASLNSINPVHTALELCFFLHRAGMEHLNITYLNFILHIVNFWQRPVTCFQRWHTLNSYMWKRNSVLREVQITVKHYNILILQICEQCCYVCSEILWTSVLTTNCWNGLYVELSVVCIKYDAMRKEFNSYMQHTYPVLSLQTASHLTLCSSHLHVTTYVYFHLFFDKLYKIQKLSLSHISLFSSEPVWRF
jgi:hypothetical protein